MNYKRKTKNQLGFVNMAVALFLVGAGLLIFALSSYIPILKNLGHSPIPSPAPASILIPENTSPILTQKQQMMLKNKKSIMKDLNIDEAHFNNLLRYASDPEFDY